MAREEVFRLIRQLCDAHHELTETVLHTAQFEDLERRDDGPEGFTVRDHLRMWVWHFWAHHRDLVRARGCLEGDNPHFHVPHFVRQANEEFGRFVGELACLTDEELDRRVPTDGTRSVREIVEHVIATLRRDMPRHIAEACATVQPSGTARDDRTGPPPTGTAPSPRRGDLVIRYVSILLHHMITDGPRSMVLRRSQPLPLCEDAPPSDRPDRVGFAHIVNRLKTMADINPQRYPEPITGTFDVRIAGKDVKVRVVFDDSAEDPSATISLA